MLTKGSGKCQHLLDISFERFGICRSCRQNAPLFRLLCLRHNHIILLAPKQQQIGSADSGGKKKWLHTVCRPHNGVREFKAEKRL
jgi:hypothetical protein